MAQIICRNDKCPYRSKRPLRKYVLKSGDQTFKCYGCTLDVVTIGPIFDLDGDLKGLLGYAPVECEEYSQYVDKVVRADE